jgi:MerR family transcriptional regulator/heat shock protein HspR
MKKKRKGFYSISVVAKMFEVHQQTIRLYEKEGLINPQRSDGGTRQFSEEDVELLERIIYLTHKVGVNLAGVEMVLKLQKKIDRLQNEVNRLFEQTHKELKDESDEYTKALSGPAKELMKIRKNKAKDPEPVGIPFDRSASAEPPSNTNSTVDDEADEIDESDFKIDYEDI